MERPHFYACINQVTMLFQARASQWHNRPKDRLEKQAKPCERRKVPSSSQLIGNLTQNVLCEATFFGCLYFGSRNSTKISSSVPSKACRLAWWWTLRWFLNKHWNIFGLVNPKLKQQIAICSRLGRVSQQICHSDTAICWYKTIRRHDRVSCHHTADFRDALEVATLSTFCHLGCLPFIWNRRSNQYSTRESWTNTQTVRTDTPSRIFSGIPNHLALISKINSDKIFTVFNRIAVNVCLHNLLPSILDEKLTKESEEW